MGQKFRTDHAGGHQKRTEHQRRGGAAHRHPRPFDVPHHERPVARCDPAQHGIFPLTGALTEQEAGQRRRHEHGKDQRAKQGKCDRPGHRLKQPALHSLQREDGQVGRDDDADREEDRALHLMRGLADLFIDREVFIAVVAQVAHDVFNHHHRAIDDHAKVQRPQRKQVCRDMAQIQTDGGKEQSERNRERHDEGAANIAQEHEQNDDDEDDALRQVMQDGMRREMQQIGPIKKRHDPHAGRQKPFVQLIDLLVNALQRLVGVGALLQQNHTFHSIIVVGELAVLAPDRFADLPQADLGSLHNGGDVGDGQRGAVLRLQRYLRNVVGGLVQAHLAHIDLLRALLDERSARVGVVGCQCGLYRGNV